MATFAIPNNSNTTNFEPFPDFAAPVHYDAVSFDDYFIGSDQHTYSDVSQAHDASQYSANQQYFASPASSVTQSAPQTLSSGHSSTSIASLGSAQSSRMASPMLAATKSRQYPYPWLSGNAEFEATIIPPNDFTFAPTALDMSSVDFNTLLAGEKMPGYVDPSLVHQLPTPTSTHNTPFLAHNIPAQAQHAFLPQQGSSPADSYVSGQNVNYFAARSQSPHSSWPSQMSGSRPPSVHSVHSQTPSEINEEGRERKKCPYPDCRKTFKDLKAHLLTHQNERPEKCPITSCEFHKRGFARKYDRNRHLVTTHYKSTMVCGFCPGSGSSAEKSFNRTDVFKRHLITVHGVEQNPPNSRKKSPKPTGKSTPNPYSDGTGKCSTCGCHFEKPQDLFEHLDDCILRVVQQTDPSEENNERLLSSVAGDSEVQETMERHNLPNTTETTYYSTEMDEDDNYDDVISPEVANRSGRSGKGSFASAKGINNPGLNMHASTGQITKHSAGGARAGLTYSKGGVALQVGKGRRKRKNYPQSWGCSMDKMKMKKRVLCVFDGQRRLWKDDMMLGNDYEVRMKLGDGEAYVTDLDVETLKRAEAFHNATEEERGPWIPSNMPNVDLEQLMKA